MPKTIIATTNFGERLDVFLASSLTDVTRSQVKRLIDEGKVTVNNKIVKAGYKIVSYDKIVVEDFEKENLNAEPEKIDLDIVYEDDDLIVVNKPQGMVVHTAVGNYSGTLVNALAYRFKNLSNLNGSFRPGIVHRLDKDTCGLLLVAKNNKAHFSLAKQIASKECKRYYIAILEGHLKQEFGTVETHIARGEINRKRMEVCDVTHGKVAITNYRVLEYLNGYTIAEFELKTGRTHQIRVHAKYLGHPVVGDKVYGFGTNKELKGQLLCAYKIVFRQPTIEKILQFSCPLPDYMTSFIKKHQ